MSGFGGGCPFSGTGRTPANPVALNNYLNSENVLFDTLHSKSSKAGAPCSNNLCQGALVFPEMEKSEHDPSKVNMEEMEQFYTQYYAQLDGSVEKRKEDLEKRLTEVREAVKRHGHYVMKTDELSYACKTAWRNASRCIGRIQWSKLKLFDGRNITSTQEMFEQICEHLEYGTNEGNIRSAISVFPCRQSGTPVRIWNAEFISYAGFEVSPGVIVGDPNHVELTKICIQLGWKPKTDRFQILPLVLQYGDNNPDMYILPDSLKLEVPISHPNYPGLAELGLKWFAVPGVSNMSMDCAGQVHEATAFNGWYMSTEIVRDLLDTNRYNLLNEIAESMGFDVSKPAVFWKDLAATELNIAIVSSFQANNVTIIDHHTASDTFMHHLEAEQTLRGGCPADWVWITPPLGGHLTSVFHQEMMNYKLKPSYEYQSKPWIGFKWKGDLRKGNVRKEKLTLRSVARALMVCYKLMKSAMRNRKQCTILYATETGQSERCAYKLQRQFEQEFNVDVCRMDKYDTKMLRNESLLILITSTFGNGEAPDNGKSFEEFLIQAAERRSNGLWSVVPSEEMTPTRFAVFGLGSSAYPSYCAFSKRVDELLSDIGLKRLMELHTGDEQKNQETAFRNWSNKIYSMSCQMHGVTIRKSSSGQSLLSDFQQNKDSYHLSPVSGTPADVHDGLKSMHSKSVAACEAVSVESLVSAGAKWESIMSTGTTCDTVLVKLRHSGIDYEPGDHLAVYPSNHTDNVKVVCNSCIYDTGINEDTVVTIKKKGNDKRSSMDRQRIPNCSVASALTNYLDIEVTPKQSDIENLLAVCQCNDEEKKLLLRLSMKEHEYNSWAESKPSWVDMLRELPSVRVPAWYFLTELPLLQPRYYSISSSPLVYPDEVHLTVTVLEYSVGKAGRERQKLGLCSNYLKNLTAGQTVQTFVRRCEGFHLPSSHSQDIIMIGAGSGLAPFRSFWQHKQYLAAHPSSDADSLRFSQGGGMFYLFQGFRTRSQALHRSELNDIVADRTIEARFTAFSREKHITKTYVQDKLTEHSELVYKLLMNRKAHVYVCGDIKMATGVSNSLKSLLTVHRESKPSRNVIEKVASCNSLNDSGISDTSSVDGSDILDTLREEGRYHEDIYSILV